MKQTVFAGTRKIQQSGPTIILVEQDVFTASRIADYLHILTGGKVIVHGKPDEVLAHKEFISTHLGTALDYSVAG